MIVNGIATRRFEEAASRVICDGHVVPRVSAPAVRCQKRPVRHRLPYRVARLKGLSRLLQRCRAGSAAMRVPAQVARSGRRSPVASLRDDPAAFCGRSEIARRWIPGAGVELVRGALLRGVAGWRECAAATRLPRAARSARLGVSGCRSRRTQSRTRGKRVPDVKRDAKRRSRAGWSTAWSLRARLTRLEN